jgi:hypothetical protein
MLRDKWTYFILFSAGDKDHRLDSDLNRQWGLALEKKDSKNRKEGIKHFLAIYASFSLTPS